MRRLSPPIGDTATAALVFAATYLFLYWTMAHRFVLSYDEGIYLDGARRILDGQVPYRDFFILMGPGSFWLQAAALKLFGLTIPASRIVVLLDFSVIAACVYWLVAKRTSRALGVFAAAACIVLETADPVVTLTNHRWDSAALAVLAVTILAEATGWWAFLAGACIAFAAWETQSMVIVAAALGIYLLLRDRARVVPFTIGVATVTAAATGMLALQGALTPMLRQMLWTGSNYSQANAVSYFSMFGDYLRLLDGAQGMEWIARGLVVLGIALPAILPLLAAACLWTGRRTQGWSILCIGAFSVLLTAWPRFDTSHLTYVAPLFYALLAIGAASNPGNKLRLPTFLLSSLLIALFMLQTFMGQRATVEVASQVGSLRATGDDVTLLRALEQNVPPGSDLFVFPYMPVAYFVTLSHNPTRYSYLQPGMMSDEDEAIALAELQAAPPERVLYYDFSEALILRLWPHTDPSRLRMRRIEEFLAKNYRKVDQVPYKGGELQWLEPATRPLQAAQIPPAAPPSHPGK